MGRCGDVGCPPVLLSLPPRQRAPCPAHAAAARLPCVLYLGERSTQGSLRVGWE